MQNKLSKIFSLEIFSLVWIMIWISTANLFLSAQLVCASGAVKPPRKPKLLFDHISIEQGLSQNTVRAILQDRNGFMWFGTTDGLNRFDGMDFKIYRRIPGEADSLIDNIVHALYEDRWGNLWIGTQEGLDKYNPHDETFTHFLYHPNDLHRLDAQRVNMIEEDREGIIWAGTMLGLNRIDPETNEVSYYIFEKNRPGSFSGTKAYHMYEDEEGAVWVGTDNGLNRWNPQTRSFTVYHNQPSDSNVDGGGGSWDERNVIIDICDAEEGYLWVATWENLYHFHKNTGTFTPFSGKPGKSIRLEGGILIDMYRDGDGIIWLGTMQKGLIRIDPVAGTMFSYKADIDNSNSLNVDLVYSIFEDRSGILWFGTYGGGVNKLDPGKNNFYHYRNLPNTKNSLSHNQVYSILEDSRSNLWIGTQGGGLNKLDRKNNIYTNYRWQKDNPKSISSDFVWCLWEDPKQRIWLGTRFGINCMDPVNEHFTHYEIKREGIDKISANFITCMYPSLSGDLWVGSYAGFLRLDLDSGKMTHFMPEINNIDSLNVPRVRRFLEDRTGKLWIATAGGGLNCMTLSNGRFKHYLYDPENKNSLGGNYLETIIETRDGLLWIAAYKGGGLNRFDGSTETFVRYGRQEGLPHDTIQGILEDKRGNLWLSTLAGLSMFNPRTETFRNYSRHDGLPFLEFTSGAYLRTASGLMYFGGNDGMIAFFPGDIINNKNITPPQVLITSFSMWNKEIKLTRPVWDTKELRLSHRDKMISFQFAALNYSAPAMNRYAYKMEGLDESWIYTGAKKRFATFSHLPPGQYRFRVKAGNNDGVWNEKGASIRILITPPFWNTWWFKLLLVSMVVALAYFLHNIRMKRLSLRLKTEGQMERLFEKYEVTQREKEIVRLILRGKTNKDIEEQLYISLNTVKSYIYRIYKKFGVQSRLELIHMIQKSVHKN